MKKNNLSKGFTLLELLVVVAIIGILASVVLASLNNARNKGGDAGVKSNLRNAITQGEVLYGTRSANKETYTNACVNGVVDGANGVGALILAAAKANGYNAYNINGVPSAPSVLLASCNSIATGWAAEVPLKSGTGMWCVDSTGKSVQTAGSTLPVGDVNCN